MFEIFKNPPTIENERLQLIPLQVEHSRPLFEVNDPSNWNYLLTVVASEYEMEEWISAAIKTREQHSAFPFVVKLKENNKVVGTTRIGNIDLKNKSCEIGSTWYGKDFQRSFVNTDCKLLLLTYCFEELRMIRVQFKTDERNLRSQKAIERIGAVREGILRNERILSNGYIRNAVVYSITNQEWDKVKQSLLNKRNTYLN